MAFHLLDVRALGALCGSREGPVASSPLHSVGVETCPICLELWGLYGRSEAAALGPELARAELQRFGGPPPPELAPELACPARLFDWIKCDDRRDHRGAHWSWSYGIAWQPEGMFSEPRASSGAAAPDCGCCWCHDGHPEQCCNRAAPARRHVIPGGSPGMARAAAPPIKAAAPSSLTPASPPVGWFFADRVASVLTAWSRAANRLVERASGRPTPRVPMDEPRGALSASAARAWGRARGVLWALIRRAALKGWN